MEEMVCFDYVIVEHVMLSGFCPSSGKGLTVVCSSFVSWVISCDCMYALKHRL